MDEIPELIELNEPSQEKQAVPITLITGYLGSGKTTLLKHILTDPNHGKRIAVILNEFGDSMDIEKYALRSTNIGKQSKENPELTSSDGEIPVEEWVELRNGCMCCSVKNAGVKAIENLVLKRPDLDHIIIETTGLADPYPIISMFWLDEELAAPVYLNGVVCVVDGTQALKRFQMDYSKSPEFLRQIVCSDRILINKCDLLSSQPEVLQAIELELQSANPLATLRQTSMSSCELDFIFDINAYADNNYDSVKRLDSTSAKHDSSVSTVCLKFDFEFMSTVSEELGVKLLDGWIEDLLWEKSHEGSVEVLRLKGIYIPSRESTKGHLYQGVCDTYNRSEIHSQLTDETSLKLVLIGRNLNNNELRESITCLLKAAAVEDTEAE